MIELDDPRNDGVTAVAEARRLEENGDAACRYGHLEFALLQYRRAAELCPLDARLAAKIARTAAESVPWSETESDWLRSLGRRCRAAGYVVAMIAVLVAAAALLVQGLRPVEEPADAAGAANAAPATLSVVPPSIPTSLAPLGSEPRASERPAIVREEPEPAAHGLKRVSAARMKSPKRAKGAPGPLVTARIDAGCGAETGNPCPVEKVPRTAHVPASPHPQPRPKGLLQLIF